MWLFHRSSRYSERASLRVAREQNSLSIYSGIRRRRRRRRRKHIKQKHKYISDNIAECTHNDNFERLGTAKSEPNNDNYDNEWRIGKRKKYNKTIFFCLFLFFALRAATRVSVCVVAGVGGFVVGAAIFFSLLLLCFIFMLFAALARIKSGYINSYNFASLAIRSLYMYTYIARVVFHVVVVVAEVANSSL